MVGRTRLTLCWCVLHLCVFVSLFLDRDLDPIFNWCVIGDLFTIGTLSRPGNRRRHHFSFKVIALERILLFFSHVASFFGAVPDHEEDAIGLNIERRSVEEVLVLTEVCPLLVRELHTREVPQGIYLSCLDIFELQVAEFAADYLIELDESRTLWYVNLNQVR